MQRTAFQGLFGGDFTHVEGYSLETTLPTGFSNRGGVQWQRGVFGQGDVRAGMFKFFTGGRVHAGASRRVLFAVGRIRGGQEELAHAGHGVSVFPRADVERVVSRVPGW